MKKMMLALACAAACAASATEWGYVGFENLDVGLMTYGDPDSVGTSQNLVDGNFLYAASSGSTDNSSVVAYDGAPSLPAGAPKAVGEKYLSLSTEGGTLWRSLNTPTLNADVEVEKGTWVDGEAVEVPEAGHLYIDTMVQFTPTEDGSEPEVGEDAKLAIWLNVAEVDGVSKTNLCVRGAVIAEDGSETPTTFTIVDGPDVVPGKWYRLTVEMVSSIDGDAVFGQQVPGFKVSLDGTVLTADKCTLTDELIETLHEMELSEVLQDVLAKKVFLPIKGLGASALTAVGFKGSGAIDEFLATDATPSFVPTFTTVEFTLAWGAGVSAVIYTIEGEEAKSAENGTPISVVSGKKVTVAATPVDEWYGITNGVGDFTVSEETTVTVEAGLKPMTELNIPGFSGSAVSTTDVKRWADGKTPKLALADVKACPFAYQSYLLNTSLLTAAPTLKIDDVAVADDQMTITVSATAGETPVDLEDIFGVLFVQTGDTLADMTTATPVKKVGDNKQTDGKLTVTLDVGKKFVKASINEDSPGAE